ncbi:MAG TPA: GNAT family N-acetyltransferase [Candidatus Sulfotelmatobacter sp.]|nr:GNAT family N-acetyltransferase [Candidatus Sulfotelmatobacter sp.]
MHPLDNVIWQALTTRQRQFAESFGQARRFVREVTSLTAFEQPDPEGYEALAYLIGPRATAAVFLPSPYEAREGWSLVGGAPLLEMVSANGGFPKADRGIQIHELGSQDSPEMVQLAALTKPGPFGTRTHELGTYLGIRDDGKLVAMAGERLKVPGYTEISAVCTHPDHIGKGYARVLMAELMQRIHTRDETAFLHVRQDNARAIELYERLGYHTRVIVHYVILRKE